MKFLCVSTAPLLAPVVPDEYRIAAASLCVTDGNAMCDLVDGDSIMSE